MRRYETIVIIDPDLGEEGRAPLFKQIRDQIDQFNGRLVKFDEWGNRKLAYKIRKKPRGHYVRLDYCGTEDLVNEMERRFKINDAFLKFMTVLQDKEIDLDAIEAEIAEEEKKEAEAREKAFLAEQEAQAKLKDAAQSETQKTEAEESAVSANQPLSDIGEEPEIEAGEPLTEEAESETTETAQPASVETSTDAPESDKKE